MTVQNGTAIPATSGVNGSKVAPSLDVTELRATYEGAGQGHVFEFWDKLSPVDQAQFADQLASIDVARVNRIYKNAVSAEAPVTPDVEIPLESASLQPPAAHLLGLDRSRSPSPRPEEVTPLPQSACATAVNNPVDEARWREIGLQAIAGNQVAVLLMAGGQGSRLGSSSPKGMYDIKLPSHRSLFEYQAARIKRLQTIAAEATGKPVDAVRIPWYVMTSGPTRPETTAYFESKDYFGLRRDDVIFFEQGE